MGMKLTPSQLISIAGILEAIDRIGVPVTQIEAEGHVLHLKCGEDGKHCLRGASLIRVPNDETISTPIRRGY